MEDVHGRCVDVVVMMLYTGEWGEGGVGGVMLTFNGGRPWKMC